MFNACTVFLSFCNGCDNATRLANKCINHVSKKSGTECLVVTFCMLVNVQRKSPNVYQRAIGMIRWGNFVCLYAGGLAGRPFNR